MTWCEELSDQSVRDKLVAGGVGMTTGWLVVGGNWDSSKNNQGENDDVLHPQSTQV